ncbi:hypothetical protein D9758_003893 [Tetrapyrgos nigripes]|uniref:C2H2-type domain-containing protein n=1 Tax=Tetrapyrgos nigripes TaxID=182062 RepID=A0A8H5GLM0_9AGAR|nr:hypothetical protein D9758_003893 [Tetrapyrgos nigripes]
MQYPALHNSAMPPVQSSRDEIRDEILIVVTEDTQGPVTVLDRVPLPLPTGVPGPNQLDFFTVYDPVTLQPPPSPSGLSDCMGQLDLDLGSPRYSPSFDADASIDPDWLSHPSSHNTGPKEVADPSGTGIDDSFLFQRPAPPPLNMFFSESAMPVLANSSSPTSPATWSSSSVSPSSSLYDLDAIPSPLGPSPSGFRTLDGNALSPVSTASESSTSSPSWAFPAGYIPGSPSSYFNAYPHRGEDDNVLGVSTFSTSSGYSTEYDFPLTPYTPESSALFAPDVGLQNFNHFSHEPTFGVTWDIHPRNETLPFSEQYVELVSTVHDFAPSLPHTGGTMMSHPTTILSDQSDQPPSSSSSDVGPNPWRFEVATKAVVAAAKKRRRTDKAHRKLFDCPHCGSSFTSSQNLRYHVDSHQGIKNFRCQDCGRAFGTPHVLRRHHKTCPRIARKRRSRSL